MTNYYLEGHELTKDEAVTMSWVSSPLWQDSIPDLSDDFEPGKKRVLYPIFEIAKKELAPGLLSTQIDNTIFWSTHYIHKESGTFVTYGNKHTFPHKQETLEFKGTNHGIDLLARKTGLVSLV